MSNRRSARARLAGLTAVLLAGQLLIAQPAVAVDANSKFIQGSASGTQSKEWFNRAFDTGPDRFFGKLRGRIRLVTDTTATRSATREVGSPDVGTVDAGSSIDASLMNAAIAARLRLTARPAIQLIFEWQPQGDSYVCDNTTFPTFPDDEWRMRTDGGGSVAEGACGAIQVAADDFASILAEDGIDLELPEVFPLLDQFYAETYGGSQSLSESREVLQIKVCKIVTTSFGLPIGDHCDIEINAVVTAPLTILGHSLQAQLCLDGGDPDETSIDCLLPLGDQHSITFTEPSAAFSEQAPCPPATREVDVRISNPLSSGRLDDITLGVTADFNVHLTADGSGVDLYTIPLPGSISILNSPMALNMTYPAATGFVLHVGQVTPDDDPPAVSLDPSAVTIDEGGSATFTPSLADLCSATPDLTASWSIDGLTLFGTTLTRTYANDLPTALHNGTLVVADQAGNAASGVAFSVTATNVAPSVQLTGLPANPVPRGTAITFGAQVVDPGADLVTWNWSFGDGTGASRAATLVTDRTDTQTYSYAVEGQYTLQVGVHDGTEAGSAGALITIFDPSDRVVGAGTFVADTSSINVPVGSRFSAQATVAYPYGAFFPSGSFVVDFLASAGGGGTAAQHLVATSYDWIVEVGLTSRTQGWATLNGQAGWMFQAEVTRSKVGAQTARVSVVVWRPGVTTIASPDYRFAGLRQRGNIQ